MNLAEPFTLNIRPSFAQLMDLDHEEREAAYRDPAWRASTWEELSGGSRRRGSALQLAVGLGGGVGVCSPIWWTAAWWSSPTSGAAPRSTSSSTSPSTTTSKARFWSVLANNDPDAIAWLLPRDNVLLGLADSGAHVSQLCDACFATDLLGNWVRDRGVMSLERAVHKLTGRAGRRVRAGRPGQRRGRQGRRPVRLRPRHRGPRAAAPRSATSRPTASGSPPTPRWG